MASRKNRKHPDGNRPTRRSNGRCSKCDGRGKKPKDSGADLSRLLCRRKKKDLKGRAALDRFIKEVDAPLLSRAIWFCRRYGRPMQDAGDYLRECYVRMLERIEQYDCNQDPLNWLTAILRNLIVSETRKSLKRGKVQDRVATRPARRDGTEPADTILMEQEDVHRLHDAIMQLPEKQRVVFTMYSEGMTLSEISQVIGCKPGTAATRNRLARQKLCSLLEIPSDVMTQKRKLRAHKNPARGH